MFNSDKYYTLRKFCDDKALDPRVGKSLCERGLLAHHTIQWGKREVLIVDDKDFEPILGEHYLLCPICGKKLLSLATSHTKACSGVSLKAFKEKYPGLELYTPLAKESLRQTDASVAKRKETVKKFYDSEEGAKAKQKMSKIMKGRFSSEGGESLREAVSAQAKESQNRPDVREKKSLALKKVRGTPEQREKASQHMKSVWGDESYRGKQMERIFANKEHYEASAASARTFLSKTSKLHLSFKESLPADIASLLTTELRVGYFHLDEGNALLKISIEIDGCYWHGCTSCGHAGVANQKGTDARKKAFLENRGWRVLHIRECELNSDKSACIRRAKEFVEAAL